MESWIRMFRAHAPRGALLLSLACLLAAGPLLARPPSSRVDLPTRTFTPPNDHASWFDQRPRDNAFSAVVLQFEQDPTRTQKQQLSRSGIQLEGSLGSGAWVAWVAAGATSKDLEGTAPRWAGPLLPGDRVNPRVDPANTPAWARGEGDTFYAVRFFRPVPESAGEALLADMGLETGAYVAPFNTWYVRGSDATPQQLARVTEVLWVDYIAPPLGPNNDNVRLLMHVDQVQAAPWNLDGSGVTACVYDGGLVDATHPDFGGRVTLGETGTTSDHATHVAGTLGDNGGPLVRGVAPAVGIVSYMYEACNPYCLYNSPQDIWDNYAEAVALHGVDLVTNSIGSNVVANGYNCDWLGDYELTSVLLDSIVRGGTGSPLTVLFAAGNERSMFSSCGDSYSTLGVPAGAKNVISVGAVGDDEIVANFSSWGPTDDGRLKPEVTAPGVGVLSSVPGGGYATMDGTSMATPAVAGVVSLLVEAWRRLDDQPDPTPAQLKAVLANGAEDLGVVGPDYKYGFGLVNAEASVNIVARLGFAAGDVVDDAAWTRDIVIGPGQPDLRVTLAWSDPPALPLASTVLVNDLDLALLSPSGSTFYPFRPDPDAPSQNTGHGRNFRDNIEQVYVEDPEAGTWTVRVRGYNVPDGPQDFGLAANVPLQEGVVTAVGVVTDAQTGQPVEHARIDVAGVPWDVRTSDTGAYSMVIPPRDGGDLAMVCRANGYLEQRAYLMDGEMSALTTRDFQLQPGGLSTLHGEVTFPDGTPAVAALITEGDDPSIQETAGIDGQFSFEVSAGRAYHLRAERDGMVAFAEINAVEGGNPAVSLVLQPLAQHPTGPDARGYIAVQTGDELPNAPTFDWVEIDPLAGGEGTRVTVPDEETPVEVALPFDFGYYGAQYSTITVCENGFFFFGPQGSLTDDEAADYSNSPIPSADGPSAMVAPFWEDFRAAETHLSTWYDPTEARFVIEWYDSRQFPIGSTRETFQVILYSTDGRPNYSGDGDILFQYLDVNDLGNATVGIESPDALDGLGLLYYDFSGAGRLDTTCASIEDSSAILFHHPAAMFTGAVTLHPANPEAVVTVRVGDQITTCDASRNFSFPWIQGGVWTLAISAEGYESHESGIELYDGTLTVNRSYALWALLPPTGLEGRLLSNNQYRLDWQPPAIDDELDEFEGRYRVYRNGSQVAEVDQLSWTDTDTPASETPYWVTAVYSGGESDTTNHVGPGITSVGETALPRSFAVSAAWPNPFNPSTSLSISLPEALPVTVDVVDLLGRRVATLASGQTLRAGQHRLQWTATGHASGLYFLRVHAGPHHAVRKVILLK